ncbi:SIMPL domain-containing protein [Spirosoma sp. SC4-14]|uniref:SIMPL domain-containing protein n=1 Tax=Spirosoma sp. SC4-14 TaxID=3128900 RepID=UPI0030CB9B0C
MINVLRYALNSTCLLFTLMAVLAQPRLGLAQSTENHLTVTGKVTEEVPADEAVLTITLTHSDDKDITLVYEQNKAAREQLIGILTQLKVPSKDIQIYQVQVRKERDYSMGPGMGQSSEKLKSYQRIAIHFSDLTRYGQVQQRLAADGFTDLSSTFSVSNPKDIELRLTELAVANAKEKADRLAKSFSRSIKRMVRIGDIEETEPIGFMLNNNPYLNTVYTMDPMRQAAIVPQTFRYTAVVKVVFELN